MSRFYMTSVNSRGNTVSAAGRSTGQDVHLRGWRSGVEVVGRPDGDKDEFVVYMTAGSSGGQRSQRIGTVVEGENGPEFVPALIPAGYVYSGPSYGDAD